MTEAGEPPAPLACPRCGLAHRIEERFCASCGMPLVYASADEATREGGGPVRRVGARLEEGPSSEAHERARKVRPSYARGDPVRVTGARNLAEAELIQGLLLERGIPSILRRTRGFDVPDFLAAGPRDVLVPASGREAARELLRDADLLSSEVPSGSLPGIGSPARLAAGILIAVAGGALIVWLLYLATG